MRPSDAHVVLKATREKVAADSTDVRERERTGIVTSRVAGTLVHRAVCDCGWESGPAMTAHAARWMLDHQHLACPFSREPGVE